ncbi:MAG: L-2-hydroxyglutarate oxidase [Dehalococcoidia bacterium]
MPPSTFDVAVIGGGILGLATAMELSGRYAGLSVVVLEKEAAIAMHQTGHNSGVIHSGLYYRPGSAKAKLAVRGAEQMLEFCQEHALPHERCGKVVVATNRHQLPALQELERRGRANGVPGMRRLGSEELREFEPHAVGVAALHVPSTGIVDYTAVANRYREIVEERGGVVRLGTRVLGFQPRTDGVRIRTTGEPIDARYVANCGGLLADRIASLGGARPTVKIVPFRGEYYELVPQRRDLVRNLIYPVPDPAFPFLGVHFTRRVDGSVEAGPNAVLAFHREGYRWRDLSARDTWETLTFPGFQRLAFKYWRTGLAEIYRSANKRAFVGALQRLLPDIVAADLVRAGAGVRAQALDASGALVDDFRIVESERMIHVLNAPSPAATASLGIGQAIADMASGWFNRPTTA